MASHQTAPEGFVAAPQRFEREPYERTPYHRPPGSEAVPPSVGPAPNANYGRPPFNPQFQRTVHSAQTSVPRSAANSIPRGAPQGYAPQPSQVQAQAINSRIASTNAAIAAIQSVTPPVIRPVPRNRPLMALAGQPQLPGGDIKGTIRFDHETGVQVVDEATAQRSAAEYSKFLGSTRKKRLNQWDAFWRYRQDVNRQILLEENECFKEAQEDANDFEESDEDDVPRRTKPIIVPYIYHNTGSLDVPPPPSVIMPDPEMVTLRLQSQHGLSQQHLIQAQQAQQAQIQAIRLQQMSARQRAVQHLKQGRPPG